MGTKKNLRDEAACRIAVAYTVALVLAAVAMGQRLTPDFATICFAGAVVMCTVRTSLPVAVAIAVLLWSFLTGFDVNQLGTLTFSDADLQRLGVLTAAAAVTWLVAGRVEPVAKPQ